MSAGALNVRVLSKEFCSWDRVNNLCNKTEHQDRCAGNPGLHSLSETDVHIDICMHAGLQIKSDGTSVCVFICCIKSAL